MKQLGLSIPLRDHADFSNYHVSRQNNEAVQAVQQLIADGRGLVFVHGNSLSGRTHLLQAACIKAQSCLGSALYLPLQDLATTAAPGILSGLDSVGLIAVDDVHCIAGQAAWEEALFHLYNRCLQSQQALLFSADVSPQKLALSLPDLRSRLTAALIYKLNPLSDQDKKACLSLRAANLGLQLSEEVAQYILLRADRNMANLMATVVRLDQETLSQRRKLTIPFVKQVMGW